MKWYVSRNGETVGPVEEPVLREWVQQGMRDAVVRDDQGGPWTPLAASPFAAGGGVAADDVLSDGWKALIYGSLLIPCVGTWVIIFVSSIMHYAWRGTHPRKAAEINKHGWIAWIIGQVVWGALYVLMS